jgi:hypothetical protein
MVIDVCAELVDKKGEEEEDGNEQEAGCCADVKVLLRGEKSGGRRRGLGEGSWWDGGEFFFLWCVIGPDQPLTVSGS